MSWTHKKMSYNIIRIENSEWHWCYSAKELEKVLNDLCRGQKFLRCMAELRGYLYMVRRSENYLDLSDMGGHTLIIFDKAVIEFDIRVEGLIGYRIAKPWDLHIHPVYDYVPSDYITDSIYFCDVKNDFELDFECHTVCNIQVDNTDTWGFSAKGFDEELADAAAKTNDLPQAIHFMLDNNVDFYLMADQIEYYMIELTQENVG